MLEAVFKTDLEADLAFEYSESKIFYIPIKSLIVTYRHVSDY